MIYSRFQVEGRVFCCYKIYEEGLVAGQVHEAEAIFTSRRLGELRSRLEHVAGAWTVERYEALVRFLVRVLPQIMEVERCAVFMSESSKDRVCSIYATGLTGKAIEAPREGSVVGEVISSGKGVIRNDLQNREGYHAAIAEKTGFVTRNMVCVPIRSVTGRGVIGAIQLLNRKEGEFSNQALQQLEEVADILATSLESIVLNREILQVSGVMGDELQQFYKGYFLDTLFVAESREMREVLDQVRMVCATPVAVLIQGENGTGKELIARMIHEGSDRRDKSFVAVNCASIPENLMESEFFGYEKGAFTGADHARRGRFEEADGGTIFLDEIADMPVSIQPKFLRAIQEGEGSRLGSNKLLKYDFRVISATNKDLKKEMEEGRFRDDLYFRLFSIELYLPALRERRDDIVPLATAFLGDISKRFNKKVGGFSPEVFDLFERYSWPGNVRQLRKEIERLVTLTPSGKIITADKCSRDLVSAAGTAPVPSGREGYSIPDQVRDLEIALIEKALQATGGNRLKASELLGITRQGLHKKMKRYHLEALGK